MYLAKRACYRCIYYEPGIMINEISRCRRFIETTNIQEPPIYMAVKKCREKEYMCGKKGKYFEPNHFIL